MIGGDGSGPILVSNIGVLYTDPSRATHEADRGLGQGTFPVPASSTSDVAQYKFGSLSKVRMTAIMM